MIIISVFNYQFSLLVSKITIFHIDQRMNTFVNFLCLLKCIAAHMVLIMGTSKKVMIHNTHIYPLRMCILIVT